MRSLLEDLKLRPWCIDRAVARSMRPGRGLRFSCKDRTDEVIKLFTICLFLQEKKTFLLKRKLAFDIRGDARAYQFIHQFKAIADQTFTGELSEVTRALNCQKAYLLS